ncbi:MAG: GNAT family N-acetyltransferase [Bacteroidota bacterium]
MKEKVIVRKATVAEAVELSLKVPELIAPPGAEVYEQKVLPVPHLILVAEVAGIPAGFKVGYEREGYWYSWLGGVKPTARRKGVARALADAQDEWARRQGYPHITFKTKNCLRAMLRFGIDRGFNIIGVDPHEEIGEYRIWLRRML